MCCCRDSAAEHHWQVRLMWRGHAACALTLGKQSVSAGLAPPPPPPPPPPPHHTCHHLLSPLSLCPDASAHCPTTPWQAAHHPAATNGDPATHRVPASLPHRDPALQLRPHSVGSNTKLPRGRMPGHWEGPAMGACSCVAPLVGQLLLPTPDHPLLLAPGHMPAMGHTQPWDTKRLVDRYRYPGGPRVRADT